MPKLTDQCLFVQAIILLANQFYNLVVSCVEYTQWVGSKTRMEYGLQTPDFVVQLLWGSQSTTYRVQSSSLALCPESKVQIPKSSF